MLPVHDDTQSAKGGGLRARGLRVVDNLVAAGVPPIKEVLFDTLEFHVIIWVKRWCSNLTIGVSKLCFVTFIRTYCQVDFRFVFVDLFVWVDNLFYRWFLFENGRFVKTPKCVRK